MWAEEPETPEEWMMRKERFYGAMRDEFYGKNAGIKRSIVVAVASGGCLADVAREWEVEVAEVERQCRWMVRRMNGEVDPPSTSVAAQEPTAYGLARLRLNARKWAAAQSAPCRVVPRAMSDEEIKRAFA